MTVANSTLSLNNQVQKVFEKRLLQISMIENRSEAFLAFLEFYGWLMCEVSGTEDQKIVCMIAGNYNRALDEIHSRHWAKQFSLSFVKDITSELWRSAYEKAEENIALYRRKYFGELTNKVFPPAEIAPFSHPFQG